MSFLAKWFKKSHRKRSNKSSKSNTPRVTPVLDTDDEDEDVNVAFSDDENVTISSQNFYTPLVSPNSTFINEIKEGETSYLNKRQAYIQELRKSFEKEQLNVDLEHQNISFAQNEELRQLEDNIKACRNDLDSYRNNLDEDGLKIFTNVEKYFKKLHADELSVQKIKNDIEIQLQTSSIRLVTEQMHLVHLDWLNEECEKKLRVQQEEYNEMLVTIENSYKQQINKLKQEIETQKDSFKLDLDIALRSIESDYLKRSEEAMLEKDNRIEVLQNEIVNGRLLSITALNDTHKAEESTSMIMLNNVTLDQSDTSMHEEQQHQYQQYLSSQIIVKSSFSDQQDLFQETLREKERIIQELHDEIEEYRNDLDNLKSKINDGSVEIMNTSEKSYKEKYLNLKHDIEDFTHPIVNALRDQLEEEFLKECESIRHEYEKQIEALKLDYENQYVLMQQEHKEEHERFESILKDDLEKAIMTYKSELLEQERKHKLDIMTLEEEFENILNNELNRMKSELEKAHKTQGCDIKFRYVSEHRVTELDRSETITTGYIAERDFEENILEITNESVQGNPALEEPVKRTQVKSIEIKAESNKQMDYEADYCELVESDESNHHEDLETLKKKIRDLDEKNAKLQETIQKFYERDDVFTASTRRQNEENENFVKLLQSDINSLTQERNSLVQNNQNLMSVLSKTMLSSTTIEEHINRRLAKIFTQVASTHSKSSSKHTSRGTSPKISSSNLNDIQQDNDSTTEDLSDEGLDISQRICDTLAAANNLDITSDEVIIETNLRVQQSIDKLLNMFEDTNKQLAESYHLQSQLADKLDEKQKELHETQTRLNNFESDNEEKLKELIEKLSTYEGLAESYENDLDKKRREIEELEERLEACTTELQSARCVIESEEKELSSMEDMRKELVAQREIFTNELQDSNMKASSHETQSSELFRNNSYLLDEKQELEHKLSKTLDVSQKQIKDLEQIIDSLNQQLKETKDKHALELEDLKSQMESMDTQIKSEKVFIESLTLEREQERDEYEAKINELRDYCNMRDIQTADNEQAALNKIKEHQRILQEKTDMLNQLRLFNEELERKLNEREKTADSLNEQIRELEKQVNEKSKSSETNEKKISQLSSEIDILMQKMKQSSETIDGYKEKLIQYELNEQDFKVNIDNLDKEKEELMLEKTELQVQLYNYMSKFSELQLKKEEIEFEFKSQLNSLEEKVKSNQLTLVDKDLTIEKQREQIIQLKEELQQKVDSELHQQNQVFGALSEGISYQDEINRLSDENMLLMRKLEQTKVELDKSLELKNSINDITQQLIESKNEEIEDLQGQIDDLKKTNEREVKLREEMEDLQIEHEQEVKKQRNELLKLENDVKSLKEEREKFILEKQEFEINCESLKKIINSQENQIQAEKDRLNTIEKNFSTVEANFNLVSRQLADKESEIIVLNESTNTLTAQIVHLKEINFNMVQENDELKAKNVKQNNQHLQAQHEFEEKLNLLSDKYKIELEEARVMSRQVDSEHVLKLQEQLKQASEELSLNELKLRNLQTTSDNLKREYDDIQKERNDAEENFNQYKEKVEKQINEYQFQIKSLLDEKDESKKGFLMQIDNLSLQLQNFKDENQNLNQKQQQDLERKYLDELKTLKEKMEIQFEVDILKIKEDHRLELDEIKHKYENERRILSERLSQLERDKEELRQQLDKDFTELDRSTSPDSTMSYDYGNKLREQVIRTQELDTKLLDTMKSKKLNRSVDDDSHMPSKIQQIMDKLDNEGVLLLSLSELLQLRNHLNQKGQGVGKLLNPTFENEKDQLTKQIYQLRELLAKVNEPQDSSRDWRGDLVRAVANVFKLEQEASLAELRTFVSSNAYVDENKIKFLENKMNAQSDLQSKSIQSLLATDRQSILSEIKHFKDENQRLVDDLKRIQEEEKQFKRDLQLMEYNKDAENIKANDLKQSLNAEKQKNLELMDKLNQERKKSNSMQEQLCDLKEEVARIKDHLAGETKNYKLLCKELDKEKALNDVLKKKCDEYESVLKQLKASAGESQQLQKINANLEDRFVELQRYANDLEHNLMNEKSTIENLQKLLNEEKQKTAAADKRLANFNMKNKFDQIQSSLRRQEKDIVIARNILNNNNTFDENNKNIAFKGNPTYGDLERLRQALELLAYRHKNEVENSDKRHGSYSQAVKTSLDEILGELKSLQLQTSTNSGTSSPVSTSFHSNIHEKLVKQNQELGETIKKLTGDKSSLKNSLSKLEQELLHLKRAVSKSQVDNTSGSLTDHDKEKFKKLYYKYLRAESFRKSLVYQKRFLLIMLSGYEDTEREILATLRLDPRLSSTLSNKTNIPPAILSRTNATNVNCDLNLSKNSSLYSNKYITNKAKSCFRTGAICIIAIHRIKFLLKKHSNILNKVDSNRQIF